MVGVTPQLTAAVDQMLAHSGQTLDQLVTQARLMAADGMDPAEQASLIGLALWDVLRVDDHGVANLAGLAATAVLRLAAQPGGER